MKEIDDFLEFLIEHSHDDRIIISKKVKFGFRHYYITFNIDEEPDNGKRRISESVEICIDNRNNCIDVSQHYGDTSIVIEDSELVKKWSEIIENYIEDNNKDRLSGFIEKTLSKCHNKNLYREYQMKKILPNNESL